MPIRRCQEVRKEATSRKREPMTMSQPVAAMTACGNRDAGDMDKTAAGTTGQMQSEETETAVSEEEALEDRMLTVAVFEDTGTLNPYTGESPAYALDWVYEGLTAMENGVPVPELAWRRASTT